jgi:hypothetical protein
MNTKTIFTICLMLIGAMTLQAQDLKPFKADNGKWGFKNENGTIAIKAEYFNALDFSEGLALVATIDDLSGFGLYSGWGFIDTKGRMVIAAKYNHASSFSEGLARVQSSETKSWGFIDKTGKEVIPLIYFDAHSFSEGYAAVRFLEPRKWGFIDKTGKEIIPFVYDKIEAHDFFRPSSHFENGKAKVKKDGRTFYIDKTGKEVK